MMIHNPPARTEPKRLFRFRREMKVSPNGDTLVKVQPNQELEISVVVGESLIRAGDGEWAKPLTKLEILLEQQAKEDRERPTPFMGFELKSLEGPKLVFTIAFASDGEVLRDEITMIFAEINRWHPRNENANGSSRTKPLPDEPLPLKLRTLGDYLANPGLEPHIQDHIRSFANCLAKGHSSSGFLFRFQWAESFGSATISGTSYRVGIFQGTGAAMLGEQMDRALARNNTNIGRLFAGKLADWMNG